ncbi:MAG: radical SAM protein [Anaerolineales bacterium]|nr:MAG: radical SAM protein [Anaerolineales bacterium]
MLTGIHFLLTYMCNSECDHCFVYSSPQAQGTFTLRQIRDVLAEAARIGTVEWVYFEGGEPFLFYPLMLEGLRIARDMGFRTGVVTNAYWAISDQDAELYLKPLQERQVADVSVSDDKFHYADEGVTPSKRAIVAAKRMGLSVGPICIEQPSVEVGSAAGQERGAPVIGGGAKFRGRAAETLTGGLPTRPWSELAECPYEDLRNPGRVHVDSYGHVHLCQGLSMGNLWETALSELVASYDGDSHPICGPLLRGGPALLVKEYGLEHAERYVDECHFCYLARLALIERFPQFLAPRQVYGLD